MLSERNRAVVVERARGDTITEIGARHGISHQRVSAIVSDANRLVGRAYLDLMVSQKTGEVCAYVIPYGENYEVAVAFVDWLIQQLRDMGAELEVEKRRATNGLVLLLTGRDGHKGRAFTAKHRRRRKQIRERT